MDNPVLKVAVNVPLSQLFDYLPPADGPCPSPGARVRVPFGRRSEAGLVIAVADGSDLPATKIRRVTETLDREALFAEDDRWLIHFTADYENPNEPFFFLISLSVLGRVRPSIGLCGPRRWVLALPATRASMWWPSTTTWRRATRSWTCVGASGCCSSYRSLSCTSL